MRSCLSCPRERDWGEARVDINIVCGVVGVNGSDYVQCLMDL